jgi:granule-bound starch synthase
MGDVLRDRGVVGIMNGIDVEEWNPEADKYLPIDGRFSSATASTGKSTMKKHLQSRLGLQVDENSVLFVFIGRLTQQKGVDVLLRALSKVVPPKLPPKPTNLSDDYLSSLPEVDEESTPRIQVVMLGTGDHWMEKSVESLEYNFPGSAKGICAFSEEMAHWMLAAADYALVPSAFEPCGLIAQCAARYGAVPIMTATGGLKNLGDSGVGILVPQSEQISDNVQNLRDYMTAAADVWGSESYNTWQTAAMQYDVSWDTSAKQWRQILTKVLYDDK